MFLKFPKIIIEFDGMECEALRLRPYDMVWFPKEYWRYRNNPYLLDAFATRRYFMLVRGKGKREGKYYLSVPVSSRMSNCIRAKQQGFSEYVKGDEEIGYWCVAV